MADPVVHRRPQVRSGAPPVQQRIRVDGRPTGRIHPVVKVGGRPRRVAAVSDVAHHVAHLYPVAHVQRRIPLQVGVIVVVAPRAGHGHGASPQPVLTDLAHQACRGGTNRCASRREEVDSFMGAALASGYNVSMCVGCHSTQSANDEVPIAQGTPGSLGPGVKVLFGPFRCEVPMGWMGGR